MNGFYFRLAMCGPADRQTDGVSRELQFNLTAMIKLKMR